ncbi:hypothetical protein CRE_14086 [Caenorhabditis remanei]|uniref:Uncharacterized protein n=1 Tax=Caenorhabditis remanei TaxID=31234 RepID=E3MRG1_CAERE|nr:hypothetical protein CRE_14086 [Caenorhabditis remanei]
MLKAFSEFCDAIYPMFRVMTVGFSENEDETTRIIESASEPKRTLQNLTLFTLALLIPVLISFFMYSLDLQDWEAK